MKKFGLIGQKLSHSFSKNYFSEKFKKEGLSGFEYELYELSNINQFPELVSSVSLSGLNVTIPYKKQVMPFLNKWSEEVEEIGAVNVIAFKDGELIGFNSDYHGFKTSLSNWINKDIAHALILGTGGASQAVQVALKHLKISYKTVSRSGNGDVSYSDIYKNPSLIQDSKLIINCTPAGMYPKIEELPDIPYQHLGSDHFLYDLVYNPEKTSFMSEGARHGCKVKNGLEMLHLQAEKAWEVWNS